MQAFETYVEGMQSWVMVAREGRDPELGDGYPPVNVTATPELAEAPDLRLKLLTEVVRPFLE
jgi:hypothetical protein